MTANDKIETPAGNAGTDLHDFTLASIHADWEQHKVLLEFSGPTTIVTATVHDWANLSLPREQPWGPSRSVNTVSCGRDGEDHHLAIELQSGDTVFVEGTVIEWSTRTKSTK